jgi:hypothetical protein
MNASFMSKHTKLAILSSLSAALFSLSAQAGIYGYTWNGSVPYPQIPQGGTTLSFQHTFAGIDYIITSVELILTFNDNASLTGPLISGIQGHLILGTDVSSPYVNFYPVATSSSGQERIYDVTFSGPSDSPGTGFNGLNPNSTWGLVLWDNSSSGIENALVSWTLDITAVPEPENVALGCFAGVFLVVSLVRSQRVRKRVHRWCVAVNQWLDAV